MKLAMELHQTLLSCLNILEKMGLVHETSDREVPLETEHYFTFNKFSPFINRILPPCHGKCPVSNVLSYKTRGYIKTVSN